MVLAILVFLPAASLSAEDDVTGRVVVERGTRGTLSGVLVPDDDEWDLQVGNDLYEIHMGQYGHGSVTTAGLKAGSQAVVNGFIYGKHISPIDLVSDGTTYRFREESGIPLWAGQGLGPYAADRPQQEAPFTETRPDEERPGWGRNSETREESERPSGDERGGRFNPPGLGRNRA